MSRSCGLLKWEKGKSYSKFLDKLANGNCHSVYLQLPFGLLAIAVRLTGNCHSVIWNGSRDDFIQGTYGNRLFEMFQKWRVFSLLMGVMENKYDLILRWLRVVKNNLRKLYLNRHLHFLFTKSPTSNHGVSVSL